MLDEIIITIMDKLQVCSMVSFGLYTISTYCLDLKEQGNIFRIFEKFIHNKLKGNEFYKRT